MYYWFLQLNWMNDKTESGISHLKGWKERNPVKSVLELNYVKSWWNMTQWVVAFVLCWRYYVRSIFRRYGIHTRWHAILT